MTVSVQALRAGQAGPGLAGRPAEFGQHHLPAGRRAGSTVTVTGGEITILIMTMMSLVQRFEPPRLPSVPGPVRAPC